MKWELKPLVQQPIIKTPTIGLYIPTKNRGPQCFAVLMSWLKLAADPANIKFLAGVDYDDPETKSLLEHYGFEVFTFDENVITNGERVMNLAAYLDVDIYLAVADYYFACTPGWDNNLRGIMQNNEVANLACVHEIYSFNFTAISKRWRDLANHLESPLFPFWFCDQWRLEMACYVFNKSPELFQNIACYGKHEKTNHLYELDFWWGLFHALRPLRLKQCHEIAKAYGYTSHDWAEFIESRKKQIDSYTGLDFNKRPSLVHLQQQFGDTRPKSLKYQRAKARADKYIADEGLEIWKMKPLLP